ncbi:MULTISPECIES: hypothetical protein [Bacillaceae]|uniref:hypothetical protein n=1 Tax=Bacillaceae TaxID=186817 RepID=UPI003000F4D6
MRVILELIRVTIILVILGGVMGGIAELIYKSLGLHVDQTSGGWLVGISILILLLVFYRNKLQFSGFYNGGGRKKLPRKVSVTLVSLSVIMLVIAPFFH